jgi:hypothetical protein
MVGIGVVSLKQQRGITVPSTLPHFLATSGDSGLLMEMVHDRCSTLLTEFGTAFDNYFTYFVPVLL